jgi:MFS family permease
MSESIIDALLKKDDDARLVSIDSIDGSVTIETTTDAIFDEIDEATVEPYLRLSNRVIRAIFIGHGSICFAISFFSLIPYYFLTYYRYKQWVFVVAVVCCVVFYLFACLTNRVPLFVIWLASLFVTASALASCIQSLAPIHAFSIGFMQSVTMLLYGFWSPKHMDPVWGFIGMAVAGALVWAVGLYAYILEQDWISCGVLFGLSVVGGSIYNAYQIYVVNVYQHASISEQELINAVICFYTWPVTWSVQIVRQRWSQTSLSYANVESTATAEPNVHATAKAHTSISPRQLKN